MSLERPLRADAERTHHAILRVADRMLSADPTATLQQIADAAGVARTTVHRRFATREALVAAMIDAIMAQVEEAIDTARTDTAPPLVALHQLTANLVTVKSVWRFTPSKPAYAESATASSVQERVHVKSLALFDRMTAAGLLDASTSRDWQLRVYHALLHEAIQEHIGQDTDVDSLADRVVTTFLHGLAPRG